MFLSNWLVQQIEVQRIDPNFTGIEILQLARILSSLSRNVHWKNVADYMYILTQLSVDVNDPSINVVFWHQGEYIRGLSG